MMMTSGAAWVRLIAGRMSRPEPSGIRTSENTRSNRSACTFLRASLAEEAVEVSWPMRRITWANESQTRASSSIISNLAIFSS